MGASNFELVFISSTWDCTTFHNFLPMVKKKNQKLAGLWLAGEVVNHVGIYGSKAAEGLSAFQRRSCFKIFWNYNNMIENKRIANLWISNTYILAKSYVVAGIPFLTRSISVIVDARSHTCKSQDFIPRYDINSIYHFMKHIIYQKIPPWLSSPPSCYSLSTVTLIDCAIN